MEVEEALVVTWCGCWGGGVPLPKLYLPAIRTLTAWTLSSLRGGSVCGKVRCWNVSAASGVLSWGLWFLKMDQGEKGLNKIVLSK